MPFPKSGRISFDDFCLENGNPKGSPINIDQIRNFCGGKRDASPEQALEDGLAQDELIPSSGQVGMANFHGAVLDKPITLTPEITGTLTLDYTGLTNPGTDNAPFIVIWYRKTDSGMLVRIGGGYDWGNLSTTEFTASTDPLYELALEVQGGGFGDVFSYNGVVEGETAGENYQYMVRPAGSVVNNTGTSETVTFDLVIKNRHDDTISRTIPVSADIDLAPSNLGYSPECIPALQTEMETYNFSFVEKENHPLRNEVIFKHSGVTPNGNTAEVVFRRHHFDSVTHIDIKRQGGDWKPLFEVSGDVQAHYLYDFVEASTHTENFEKVGAPLTLLEMTGEDKITFRFSVSNGTVDEVSEVSVGFFLGDMANTPRGVNVHLKLSKDFTSVEYFPRPTIQPRIEESFDFVNNVTGQNISETFSLSSNGSVVSFSYPGGSHQICESGSDLEYSFEVDTLPKFSVSKELSDGSFVPTNELSDRVFRDVSSSLDETITIDCPLSSKTRAVLLVVVRDKLYPAYFQKSVFELNFENQSEAPITIDERLFENLLTRVAPGEYVKNEVVAQVPRYATEGRSYEMVFTRDGDVTSAIFGGEVEVLDDTGVDLEFSITNTTGQIETRNISVDGPGTILGDGESLSFRIQRRPMDETGLLQPGHSDPVNFDFTIEQPSYGVTQVFNFTFQFDFSNLVSNLVFREPIQIENLQIDANQSFEKGYPTLAGVTLQDRTDGFWAMKFPGGDDAKYELQLDQKLATGGGTLQYRIIPISGTVEQFSGVVWDNWYDAHPSVDLGLYTVVTKLPVLDDGLLGQTLNGVYNPDIQPISGAGLYAGKPSDFHNYVILSQNGDVTRTIFRVQYRDKYTKTLFFEKDVTVHYNLI